MILTPALLVLFGALVAILWVGDAIREAPTYRDLPPAQVERVEAP